MKWILAVALLLATTGCIDVPAMNGLMDRLVPEPEIVYREEVIAHFEGEFKPDPDQDQDAALEAAEKILNDPAQIGAVAQNISWVEYTYVFPVPPGATWLQVEITVDYSLVGGGQPEEGPAGTLDLTFREPAPDGQLGEERCRDERTPPCFEIVYFNDGEKEIDGYVAPLPPVPGQWTITISGSGMDGLLGELIYSGNYKMNVITELPSS